eukprot:9272869-Lingulodinium_polyedra.AAC.1
MGGIGACSGATAGAWACATVPYSLNSNRSTRLCAWRTSRATMLAICGMLANAASERRGNATSTFSVRN